MHILVFHQYYNTPDCFGSGRHYTFMEQWGRTHNVTVISTTARMHKRTSHSFPDAPPGVRLKLFDVPYANTMSTRARLRAFARYATGAFRRGLSVPRPDVIFGTSTPLTAAWAAAQVARVRRVPWVFEVRDLWPDFPVQMGALPNPWLQKRLYGMEKNLYQRADHIIPLSSGMAEHIRAQGIPPERITTQFNGSSMDLLARWSDADVAALRRQHGLADRKVILYAGTFGRANDIPTLMAAAAQLAHRNDWAFVFVGHGYHAEALQQAARTQDNLFVLPQQPKHQAYGWYRMAALSLVSFVDLPVLATNSPSKLFDSLSSGAPVVVNTAGWMKTFVETHGCGWHVPAGNADALAGCIRQVLDTPGLLDNARAAGLQLAPTFDRVHLAQEIASIFEKLVP